jgi:hypothetical protein
MSWGLSLRMRTSPTSFRDADSPRFHITETCEEDLPNIITDVQTAPVPVADGEATPLIHETLKEKDLLSETQ